MINIISSIAILASFLIIFSLFWQPMFLILFWFLFWLTSFLLLLAGRSTIFIGLITAFLWLIFLVFYWQDLTFPLLIIILWFVIFFGREKIFQRRIARELKVRVFQQAYLDFRLFTRLTLYLVIFLFLLANFWQLVDFQKIFQTSFDFFDQLTARFQIGLSSKMTVFDLMQKELAKLSLPVLTEPELYQSALQMLGQSFNLTLKPETTIRELIWQSLQQSALARLSFLILLTIIFLSFASFLISLLSFPAGLLAQIVVSFLLKLKLLRRVKEMVEKESFSF